MRKPKRFSHLKSPSPSLESRPEELHFVKEGHHYLVRYEEGQELTVVCSLLSAAMDGRLNMNLDDAKDILKSLGMNVSQF